MKLSLLTILLSAIFSPIALGFDFATEHTQILNTIELITENARQLQSLYNEVAMIKNQVEGLKSVATYQNNLGQIDTLRNQLADMISQGTALSNQTQDILTTMRREIGNMPAGGTMTDSQETVDQRALDLIQNALGRVKQLRASYQQEINSVNALMDKNTQAIGQTQALQTANALSAQNIAQTQSMRELLSEQISMQAAMMSKQIREEKDEDDKMKQIFNMTGHDSITASQSL